MIVTKLGLKVWRDFKQMKLRGLAVTVAIAFWVAYYGGYYMAIESGKYSYQRVCRDLNLADLQIFVEPSTEEELPRLDGIPGVRICKKRLFVPGSVVLKNGDSLPVYVIYDDFSERAPINNLKILEGALLAEEDNGSPIPKVLIDRTMASAHGFGVGDRLVLTLSGNETEIEVKGVVLSPEFLYPSANPSLLLTARGSLGVIFSDMQEVTKVFGYPLFNNLAFAFDERSDVRALEERIRSVFSARQLQAFLPQRELLDYKIISGGYTFAKKFGPIASTVMIIVVFVILYINLYRMIEERRMETAVLGALGFSSRNVLWYFIRIVILYITIGSSIGFCGSFFLNPAFAVNFARHLEFPELRFVCVPRFPLRGIAYGILVTSVAFVCASFGLWKPSFRRVVKKRGYTLHPRSMRWCSLRGKCGAFVNRSLFAKYAFRGMLRRRNLTIVTIVSVAFALALAVSFNILLTSTNRTLRDFYDQDRWDLILDFTTTVEEQDIAQLLPKEGVAHYEGYLKGMGRLMVNRKWSFAQIIGLNAGSTMRNLEVVEGRGFSGNDAPEIILNRNLWKEAPLEVGQTIIVETPNGRHDVKLVGIVDEVSIAIEYAYLPIITAQRLLHKPDGYTGVWVQKAARFAEFERTLRSNEMISRITLKEDIERIIDQFLASYRAGITGVLAMVMALGPIFLFTTMGLSILEKERDLIILRSMGFERGHIARILMVEVFFMGTIATAASFGLAILLGLLQNKLAGETYFSLKTHVALADYSYVFLCFPLFPLVALVFTRRIMRLDIVERLARRIS